MHRIFTASIAAAFAAVASLTAASAGASTVPAPQSAAAKAYYAQGEIHPTDNPHYCLTRSFTPKDNEPTLWLPCFKVKNYAPQTWYLYKVLGVGQIEVTGTDETALGQLGKSYRAVTIFIPEHALGEYNSTVQFINYEKGTTVNLFVGKKKVPYFLSAPVHMKAKKAVSNKPYYADWEKGQPSSKVNQEFILPVWHEVSS
jgi:hypothetical protein